MELDRKIYVIMPFSTTNDEHIEKYWTDHYENLLKPSIKEITEIPVEQSKALRTDIIRDIIKNLIFSQIVIADITDFNKNVMWELGVRQSFGNGTIVIAEDGTERPFDIATKGIISYPKLNSSASNYHSEMRKFKEDLRIAINDCIEHPEKIDSHVLETISGRGTIYQIISHEEIIRKLDAIINELNSNIKLISICTRIIEENKKFKDGEIGFNWITARFREKSIELLLTTRYLTQNEAFYSNLERYYDYIQRMNTQIEIWADKRRPAEKFLVKNCGKFKNISEEILKTINEIRDNMDRII